MIVAIVTNTITRDQEDKNNILVINYCKNGPKIKIVQYKKIKV